MKKIFLGFAGEMASGKGTATELVKQWYPGTPSFRFSDSLREFYVRLASYLATASGEHGLHAHLVENLHAAFGIPDPRGALRDEFARFAAWVSEEFIASQKGAWPKEASTPQLQALSTAVRRHFGENILEHALLRRAAGVVTPSPFVVIEGIRRLVDIGSLMHDSKVIFRLTYVFAHANIRHERHRSRNEKPGDALLTFEQFTQLGNAEAEREIRLLQGHAHAVIDNSGPPEAFEAAVSATISDWLLEIQGA